MSFASPCVLPLVPGYLGYVTGLTGVDLAEQRRWRVVTGAVLFVLGFSTVFLLMGFTAGAVGGTLYRWQDEIARVLGVVVVVMGLVFLGVLDRVLPWLSDDRRPGWRPATGLAGAPLLGLVFGLGWAPCIGPVFSAVALLGFNEGTAGRGVVLAAAYCLGLGLPFVLVAAGFGRGRVLDCAARPPSGVDPGRRGAAGARRAAAGDRRVERDGSTCCASPSPASRR